MSDHAEVPRIEFDDSGYSMNKVEAMSRFARLLNEAETRMIAGEWAPFTVKVDLRPCDCPQTLNGHDDHCPLHGSKA